MTDVVVVLPGIMGSTLGRHGSPVWSPSAGSVVRAIQSFGASIRELTLPAGIGDDDPADGVQPIALMPDLHMLPGVWSWNVGYDVLLNFLRSRFDTMEAVAGDADRIPNLLAVPYDWRLSNRLNGRRLKEIVEPALERWRSQGAPFDEAKLIFVCHSMGGLVARWYIEREGGAAVTRKLVTLGTPHRGAMNALDQLVNGVRRGIGPLRLDFTTFGRSLPSLHQLLPEYACLESPNGLLKITEAGLPELSKDIVADAMRFHDEVDATAARDEGLPYDLHPIVGIRQKTLTTARMTEKSIQPADTISGADERGDATVPRLSAIPKHVRPDSPTIRWVADQHGALQSNRAVLDELEGILTAQPVAHRAGPEITLGVEVEQLILRGEDLVVSADVHGVERIGLQVRVADETGALVATSMMRSTLGDHRADVGGLEPGAYRVTVGGVGSMASIVAPVTTSILVWPRQA